MKYTNNTIRINVIFIVCIVLLFGIFFAKLAYISLNDVVEGTDIAELAKNRSIATKTLTAKRGNIYDLNNEVLAENVNSYTLVAILSESRTIDERYPKHVVDKELTATELSKILKIDKAYILNLLNKDAYQTEFGPAGKGLTENVKREIEELSLPGIEFVKTTKRNYPNGDFASYVIGYAKIQNDGDLMGELGIEAYCDRYLKGKDGTITYQRDAYGYQMADKESYVTPAQDGFDVFLTLDSNVQLLLNTAVDEFNDFDPSWVTLTVADAKTGSIIGSSTSPSFDLNKLNIKYYTNPLTSYTYEPGSTMKIFSFMTAMEEGKYDGDALYQSGTRKIDEYTIKDWNKYGWGKISYDTGFTYSSNTAAVDLTYGEKGVGRKVLRDYYSNLGFGSLTGIELSGELKGDIDFQYATEVASASYGQGITVTPIQMIQALSVLTNDGVVLKPYIIDKIVDPNTNKVVYSGKRTEVKKVYSTSTVKKIIELMDKTVNSSDKKVTGYGYHTDAVRLIGKTGTADYTGEDGKYNTGTYTNIRSFAGVFPKENPEYIIYVAVKDFHGSSNQMGNIVKKLVESVAKYRNFDERPSDLDPSKIVTIDNYVNKSVLSSVSRLNSKGVSSIVIGDGATVISQYPKRNTKTSQKSKVFLISNGSKITMPDIKGWSSAEFIDFCNIVGVKYELEGYGYVQDVNIPVGAILNDDITIKSTLKNLEPVSLVTQEDNDDKGNNKEDEKKD